jgi:hypothetical protein
MRTPARALCLSQLWHEAPEAVNTRMHQIRLAAAGALAAQSIYAECFNAVYFHNQKDGSASSKKWTKQQTVRKGLLCPKTDALKIADLVSIATIGNYLCKSRTVKLSATL